jgi:hypothetical protein
MKISKEDLIFRQELALFRLRLFYFYDHIGAIQGCSTLEMKLHYMWE